MKQDIGRRGTPPIKGLVGGQYKPLTEDQVRDIHEASLAILERTGVQVEQSEALRYLREAGAEVEGSRVRITSSMVEDGISKAPSRVVLAGRDPTHDLILEDARVYIGTGGAALRVVDMETGEIRPTELRDVAHTARIVDALENIHFYLVPVYPADVPDEMVEINKFYASLVNTTKHVQSGVYSIRAFEMSLKCVSVSLGVSRLYMIGR